MKNLKFCVLLCTITPIFAASQPEHDGDSAYHDSLAASSNASDTSDEQDPHKLDDKYPFELNDPYFIPYNPNQQNQSDTRYVHTGPSLIVNLDQVLKRIREDEAAKAAEARRQIAMHEALIIMPRALETLQQSLETIQKAKIAMAETQEATVIEQAQEAMRRAQEAILQAQTIIQRIQGAL